MKFLIREVLIFPLALVLMLVVGIKNCLLSLICLLASTGTKGDSTEEG